MLCKKCGAEIPDNAKKCEYCGAPVQPSRVTSTESKNEQNRRNQIDKMMEDKQAQLDEIKQRRDDKRIRQRRAKVAGITAACVLGAAALGGGGYYIYNTVSGGGVVKTTPAPTTIAKTPLPTAIPANGSPIPAITPGTSPMVSVVSESENNDSSRSGNSDSDSSSGSGSSSGSSSSGSGSSSSGGSSSNGGSSSDGSASSISSSGGGSSSGGSSSSSVGNPNAVIVRDSGITSSAISSQLAVGNDVIHDGDNWYMTFTSGGIKYYAIVNPGATTEQVNGVQYTLTAQPTDASYRGNTVYEITSMTKYDGTDYILPDSGTRLLTKDDIQGLSSEDLALARNEIYARHGRRFMTEIYQTYFESKSWYHENPNYNYDDDNSNLNEIEIKNVQFIIDYEN